MDISEEELDAFATLKTCRLTEDGLLIEQEYNGEIYPKIVRREGVSSPSRLCKLILDLPRGESSVPMNIVSDLIANFMAGEVK